MNEIIKELSNQAYDELVEETGNIVVFDEDLQQRFAELIIREIIEELEADVIDMYDDPDDYERGYDNGVKNSVAHIKEHFGVEK